MKKCPKIFALLVFSVVCVGLYGQNPEPEPPDISNPPSSPPFALGNRVVPPFVSSSPGLDTLPGGQNTTLRIITNVTGDVSIRWRKDGIIIPNEDNHTLVINSASASDAGVYAVEVLSGGVIAASGEMVFAVDADAIEDAFLTWIGQFFEGAALDDPLVTGFAADPDKDGLSNLSEYAFGLDPSAAGGSPHFEFVDKSGSDVSFAYVRARQTGSLKISYEGSSALIDWVPLNVASSTVEPIDLTKESVDVDLVWPNADAGRKFIRIGIERTDTPNTQ